MNASVVAHGLSAYRLHQIRHLHLQRLRYTLQCLEANLPFPHFQLADVGLAQFRVGRKVDLPPSALTT